MIGANDTTFFLQFHPMLFSVRIVIGPPNSNIFSLVTVQQLRLKNDGLYFFRSYMKAISCSEIILNVKVLV